MVQRTVIKVAIVRSEPRIMQIRGKADDILKRGWICVHLVAKA